LAAGIGNGLQLFHQVAGQGEHRESFPSDRRYSEKLPY
jgi:hypothetical protein